MSSKIVPPTLAAEPWRLGHTAPTLAGGPAESGDANIGEIERQAREEGRRVGYEAGLHYGQAQTAEQAERKLDQECRSVLAEAAAGVEQTVALRYRLRRQMEADLVRLAIAVARRILHRELSVDPDALVGIVKAVIAKIEVRDLHQLRVATPDKAILESHLAGLRLPERVEIAGDPALPRGSLHLEISRGQIDASIDTQLDEIDRGLTDLVKRAT